MTMELQTADDKEIEMKEVLENTDSQLEPLKVDLEHNTTTATNAIGQEKYKAPFTCRLSLAITAAVIGSAFQHGYNTGVVNAPQQLIEQWIRLVLSSRSNSSLEEISPSQVTALWSVAVSIFCVGGMIGGALTGLVADRFGRRNGLLLNNLLGVLGALLQGGASLCDSVELLILGRLLIGACAGLGAGLAPLYLAEIAPLNYRGAVGTVYQLVVTLSILVSQTLGLPGCLGSARLWPLLLGFSVLPAGLQLAALPFCPETPQYLAAKGRHEEAAKALSWLRGATRQCTSELDQLLRRPPSAAPMSLRCLLWPRGGGSRLMGPLATPLLAVAGVMLAQQFSGINAVMFYSTDVFRQAGMSGDDAKYATLGMGLVNVLATVVSLVLVERAGRRPLLISGLSGMCVNSALLAVALYFASRYTDGLWSVLAVVLVLTYVTLFASGPGSIPWFLASELFDDRARPPATALAVVVNWAANFIVGIGFLPLQMALGGWVFLVFAFLLAISALFVYRKVPETKNKTPEEIRHHFNIARNDTSASNGAAN